MSNDAPPPPPAFSAAHSQALDAIVQTYVDGTALFMDATFDLYQKAREFCDALGIPFSSGIIQPFKDQLQAQADLHRTAGDRGAGGGGLPGGNPSGHEGSGGNGGDGNSNTGGRKRRLEDDRDDQPAAKRTKVDYRTFIGGEVDQLLNSVLSEEQHAPRTSVPRVPLEICHPQPVRGLRRDHREHVHGRAGPGTTNRHRRQLSGIARSGNSTRLSRLRSPTGRMSCRRRIIQFDRAARGEISQTPRLLLIPSAYTSSRKPKIGKHVLRRRLTASVPVDAKSAATSITVAAASRTAIEGTSASNVKLATTSRRTAPRNVRLELSARLDLGVVTIVEEEEEEEEASVTPSLPVSGALVHDAGSGRLELQLGSRLPAPLQPTIRPLTPVTPATHDGGSAK